MTIELTLAHSPDSDDLVMWWPLTGQLSPDGTPVSGPLGEPAIDTGRFSFRTIPADIEALNRRARDHEQHVSYDITAISAHTYPHVRDRYRITLGGGSFGEGYGPKVVVRTDSSIKCAGCLSGQDPLIAVPGTNTTAFLTLSLMLGAETHREVPFRHEVMLFSAIPGAVADGRVDAGLLIHEAQLTFEELGLRVVADLGTWWSTQPGSEHGDLPLPLGLNVIRRDLDERFGPGSVAEVSELLSKSIAHAREHADASYAYLQLHGTDRPEWNDRELVDRYLRMYVSELTHDMGNRGRLALHALLERGHRAGLCPDPGPIDPI